MDLSFYKGKRVFVTGHTGFKGSWLCRMLVGAGAIVTGYSLDPPTEPNLFDLAGLAGKMTDVRGDIRDLDKLKAAYDAAGPEIVLHLAAQPIVRDSYKDPRYTYETNVMGTVDLLECVRLAMAEGRAPRRLRPLLQLQELLGACDAQLHQQLFPGAWCPGGVDGAGGQRHRRGRLRQ